MLLFISIDKLKLCVTTDAYVDALNIIKTAVSHYQYNAGAGLGTWTRRVSQNIPMPALPVNMTQALTPQERLAHYQALLRPAADAFVDVTSSTSISASTNVKLSSKFFKIPFFSLSSFFFFFFFFFRGGIIHNIFTCSFFFLQTLVEGKDEIFRILSCRQNDLTRRTSIIRTYWRSSFPWTSV